MIKKRGQVDERLIFLAIAIIAAILLIFWLSGGYKGFFSWFKLQGPTPNADAFGESCKQKCMIESPQDYCCTIKKVKFSDSGTEEKITCNDARIKAISGCNVVCNTGVCSLLTCENRGGSLLYACTTDQPLEIAEFDRSKIAGPAGDAGANCAEQKIVKDPAANPIVTVSGTLKDSACTADEYTVASKDSAAASTTASGTTAAKVCCVAKTDIKLKDKCCM